MTRQRTPPDSVYQPKYDDDPEAYVRSAVSPLPSNFSYKEYLEYGDEACLLLPEPERTRGITLGVFLRTENAVLEARRRSWWSSPPPALFERMQQAALQLRDPHEKEYYLAKCRRIKEQCHPGSRLKNAISTLGIRLRANLRGLRQSRSVHH